MTPQEQRIAIAEACGWKHYHEDLWVDPDFSGDPDGFSELQCGDLPDYHSDLNAMHEAEAILTEKQRLFYHVNLMKLQKADFVAGFWFLIHATAAQRAEAFLRTIGKWTTNPNVKP
jgi:hypothetical protein